MDNRNAVWRHVDAQSERLIALLSASLASALAAQGHRGA